MPCVSQHPSKPYNGLTIILSQPSRHDIENGYLFSGVAGAAFKELLFPLSLDAAHVILLPDYGLNSHQLRPETKTVILLGEPALQAFKGREANLNDYRGCPFKLTNSIYVIATYQPQDAYDRKNYDTDEEENEQETANEKEHQKTRRVHWRFWLKADIRKAVRINRTGILSVGETETILFGSMAEVVDYLRNPAYVRLYLDIETDRAQMLTCLGLGFQTGNKETGTIRKIFVIPFRRYDKTMAYSAQEYCSLFQALAVAFLTKEAVIHNSLFDLMVLGWRYRLPFPRRIFDTMLAHHRCWPELEKSLGHCVSYYTDEPFHKNEGVFEPHNSQQELALWQYNAKDIATMILIREAQEEEIKKRRAESSVAQVMKSIRPYGFAMLRGLRIDETKRQARIERRKREEKQLQRILTAVTKMELNPRSHQQVSNYLYKILGLKCPNDKEPTNEKTLMRVAITNGGVPSIQIILKLRASRKAYSALAFNVWPGIPKSI